MMPHGPVNAAGKDGGHQAVGRRLDVYRQNAIGADGGGRVVFVRLDPIEQTGGEPLPRPFRIMPLWSCLRG